MAAEPFVHVMLVYSLKEQRLINQKIFEDEPDNRGQAIKRAMDAYMDEERANIDSDDVEIVLVGADSLSTIKTTHRSYFAEDVPVSDIDRIIRELTELLERQHETTEPSTP